MGPHDYVRISAGFPRGTPPVRREQLELVKKTAEVRARSAAKVFTSATHGLLLSNIKSFGISSNSNSSNGSSNSNHGKGTGGNRKSLSRATSLDHALSLGRECSESHHDDDDVYLTAIRHTTHR